MRAALLSLLLASPALSAPCGGDFSDFLSAMEAEAAAAGIPADKAAAFFAGGSVDPAVLKADKAQGVFRKTFLDFSQSLISKGRLTTARDKAQALDEIFTRAETEYGVSRGVLLAFWAFETDFGQVQGDFNTRNALLTLAHDCRRPELFQPQVLAAAQLFAL
ncbi:MAG: lytic murein transglycosylase, partial [Tabrizicola sp.]|nr:lytic murein transglycosylase [Tabrizicola sp.]